ncbi:MAG TPA: phosphoenolpyruvate synthase, partial [bacterium]|nr:phosphoenolpyruvate synthase [bacterium]
MHYLLDPPHPIDPQRLGGKATALARLSAAGLAIPDWFVVEPAAFEASLLAPLPETEVEVAQVLRALTPSAALLDALKQRLLLAGGGHWAVRSSALDEDGAQHSFAGQLESWLNVPAEEVAQRVVDVWRSGFAARVWAYRREAGLPPRPHPPAVLVQRMIDAEAAGVAFAADPVNGRRDVAVVSAVHGLGTALVGGEADADTWRVDEAGSIIEFSPADMHIAHRCDAEASDGLRVETLSGVGAPLSDAQVREVATLARAASRYFERPQDIEWAMADGRLYLLQSRPITALGALADP